MKKQNCLFRLFALAMCLLLTVGLIPVSAASPADYITWAYYGSDSRAYSPAVLVKEGETVYAYTSNAYTSDTITVKTNSGTSFKGKFDKSYDGLFARWNCGITTKKDNAILTPGQPSERDKLAIYYSDNNSVSTQANTFTGKYSEGKDCNYLGLDYSCPSFFYPCPVIGKNSEVVALFLSDKIAACPWMSYGSTSNSSTVYEMRSMSNYGLGDNEYTNGFWGQFKVKHNKVAHIVFQSTLAGMGSKAWDVSAKKDRSVMAWMDDDTLYVGAEGRIAPNKDARNLFAKFAALKDIDFGGCFDTSNVTDMSCMFYGSYNLEELDLTCFDTAKVTNMNAMFAGLKSLEDIDVSSFDTSKVKNMGRMFEYCSNLTELDLSGFNTSKVTTMKSMFNNCRKLEYLDISNFTSKNVTNGKLMFQHTNSLETIVASDFTFVQWKRNS